MKSLLQKYREEIDEIDEQMINLLQLRFQIVEKIGEYKRQTGLRVRDRKREQEKIKDLEKKECMYQAEIQQIYQSIFRVSKKAQKRQKNKKNPKTG